MVDPPMCGVSELGAGLNVRLGIGTSPGGG